MAGSGKRSSGAKTATRAASTRRVESERAGDSFLPKTYPSWAKTPKLRAQWDATKAARQAPGYKSEAQRKVEAKMKSSRDWEAGKKRAKKQTISSADVARGRRRAGSNWTGD